MRLPLSWIRRPLDHPRFQLRQLPASRRWWLALGDIPQHKTFTDCLPFIREITADRFVIRGCHAPIAEQIRAMGGEALTVGAEALLDLQSGGIPKQSLRELIRRGNRWGTVHENSPTEAGIAEWQRFRRMTVHNHEPQLQFLFRDRFREPLRCFVFEGRQRKWLGGLTVSPQSGHFCHTELILRAHDAPIGVMEALISTVRATLAREGFDYWSLGEVPFYGVPFPPDMKSAMMMAGGRRLRYAYNAHGLFHFKNKFSPRWEPLYLCGYPQVPWRALIDLFFETRLASLCWYKLSGRYKKNRHRRAVCATMPVDVRGLFGETC